MKGVVVVVLTVKCFASVLDPEEEDDDSNDNERCVTRREKGGEEGRP